MTGKGLKQDYNKRSLTYETWCHTCYTRAVRKIEEEEEDEDEGRRITKRKVRRKP